MPELTVPAIRQALLARPRIIQPPGPDRPLACVAMVLAGPPEDPQLCLIRRALRAGDPWSGHMAFPGGRADETDTTAQGVAEREAAEEVGLRLNPGDLLGPLTELPVRAGGQDLLMKLAAFVYRLDGPPPPLVPQTTEVAQALWAPLAMVYDPGSRTRYRFTRAGTALDFPGVALDGHIVWGLTYRVLAELGDRMGRPLPLD